MIRLLAVDRIDGSLSDGLRHAKQRRLYYCHDPHPRRRRSGRPRRVRHAAHAGEAGRPGRRCRAQGRSSPSFPRRSSSAYPKGLDFGARVGSRTPEGREQFRRYFESAIEVPGPGDRAPSAGRPQAGGLHLVVGVIERDGGTLYCTVLFFGPDGRLLGKHRKLMPTAMERLVWGFGDGSTLTGRRHAARQARRGDLLGELHAAAAHGDVRQGRAALLRPDRRRPRDLAADACGTSPWKAAASCCRPAST